MKSLILLALMLCALPAMADERILDFSSHIDVQRSGDLRVTENITVRAEGRQIRHGIYRDFPILYRGRNGVSDRVGFEPLTVKMDGKPVPYHTKKISNGIRVYMGSSAGRVSQGRHRFTLVYRTDRQLGYFKDHDELYWNVTGNGWAFPIDRASASVSLPGDVPTDAIKVEAYTGQQGDRGKNYRASVSADGDARFETLRPMPPHAGLTIVVSWPKGYVHEPSRQERLRWFVRDNANLIAGIGGLALLLIYYLLVWRAVGRDTEAGVVIPRYQPPAGFSPASARFIRRMGYDHKAFTAAVVNLAVKGTLTIDKRGDTYSLARLRDTRPSLAPGEKVLLDNLFKDGDTLELKKSRHAVIGGALKKHKRALQRDYEKRYFNTNSRWVIPGILMTIGLLVANALLAPNRDAAFVPLFMTVWLSIWSLGVFMLGNAVVSAWRNSAWRAIPIALFATPFFIGEIAGIWILFTTAGVATVLILLLAIGINVLFYQLLKAPTLAGRKLLDELEGFRLYLQVAEKDEMNLRNPPEKTPALFETFLPYALALDVEQEWAERFANVFAEMDGRQEHYHPGWYSGSGFSTAAIGGFAGSLGGALTSAISSSSTAPGSSSGSGGGGFSGGGGGGGGGGGW